MNRKGLNLLGVPRRGGDLPWSRSMPGAEFDQSRVQIGGPLRDYSETGWIPIEFRTSPPSAG
jgi:hypothetical protein